MEMEKQKFGHVYLLSHSGMVGHWTLTSGLLSLPHHTQPTLFADVSGDSSILRTGHVSKFFRQLREHNKKNFLSLLFVKKKIILS